VISFSLPFLLIGTWLSSQIIFLVIFLINGTQYHYPGEIRGICRLKIRAAILAHIALIFLPYLNALVPLAIF
jgi:hypothetical protein